MAFRPAACRVISSTYHLQRLHERRTELSSCGYQQMAVAVIPARARTGCYAGIMTVTLHLDGAVAEALAAEAARRGQTADQFAADLLAAQLPRAPRRRLAFAAVGASTSGRGAARPMRCWPRDSDAIRC